MKPIFEWYNRVLVGGARIWRVPFISGTRTFTLLMSEGPLPMPTFTDVQTLPSVANGRYTPDDAISQIVSFTNVGQLAIETQTGRYYFGHPAEVYAPRTGAQTAEEIALRGWLVGRAIPAAGVMADFVGGLRGQIVARARYGGSTTEGQFNQTLLNGYDANGNATSFRTWGAASVPDGFAEINASAGGSDSDRYLVWFGSGRGGFRIHNPASADGGATPWNPAENYYMGEPGTGAVTTNAHTTKPQIIPDDLSVLLRGTQLKRSLKARASGPTPHYSTGLYLQGCVTLPSNFIPQWTAATRILIGSTTYATDLLAWPGRPMAFQEPGCADGVIRTTGRMLADYFLRVAQRNDRPYALPPDQLAALQRMRSSGDVYTYQWSTTGFTVQRLQSWSGEFANAEGSAELIPRNNAGPALTITGFNTKWVGRRVTALMGAASHGPGSPPITVALDAGTSLRFRDPVSETVFVVTAAGSAEANQVLALIGDDYIWAASSHGEIQRRMDLLGLGVLKDQLDPPTTERRYEDVFPLLPTMTEATGTAQADAFLAMGVNLNVDLCRAAITMRNGELQHVREMSRRYDEVPAPLAVTP